MTDARWLVAFPVPPYMFDGMARDAVDAISQAAALIDPPDPPFVMTFTVQSYPESAPTGETVPTGAAGAHRAEKS